MADIDAFKCRFLALILRGAENRGMTVLLFLSD